MKSFILFLIVVISSAVSLKTVYCQPSQLIAGFPVNIDSTTYPTGGTSPIVADFNGDGQNEILICYKDKDGSGIAKIIKHDGTTVNNWPIVFSAGYGPGIKTAAGDVDDDNFIDIVIRTTEKIYLLDHSGNIAANFPISLPSADLTNITLYDLDNDNNLEIITVSRNKVYVFEHDGIVRQGWPQTLRGDDPLYVYCFQVTVGDINNDNIPELITPYSYCPTLCTINEINIYEPNGSNYLGFPIVSDSNYHFIFSAASLYRKNNSSNIVINSSQEIGTGSTTRTTVYGTDGNILNRMFTSSEHNTAGSVSLGIHDNQQDFLFCFGYQNHLSYLLNENGSGFFPGWPMMGESFLDKTAAIAKIKNKTAVILTGKDSDSTGPGGYQGYISASNLYGEKYSWSPLRPRGVPNSSVTVCDLNKDGIMDIISFNTYSYLSNGSYESGRILYAWSLTGIPYSPDAMQWPMLGHDRYRTYQYGFVPTDDPVGIISSGEIQPASYSLEQNYPNPFNPMTNLEFGISNLGFVSLKVYDALGSEVVTLVNEKLSAGNYKVEFDGTDLPSGVYFYKLETQSFSETKRMVLLK